MNQVIYEFLAKTNNNPHKAWDEYIKYHLLAGKQMPEDIRGIQDFIKASKPDHPKVKRKASVKRSAEPTEYKIDNIEDAISEIKNAINVNDECMKFYKIKNNKESYMNS